VSPLKNPNRCGGCGDAGYLCPSGHLCCGWSGRTAPCDPANPVQCGENGDPTDACPGPIACNHCAPGGESTPLSPQRAEQRFANTGSNSAPGGER
jgi:hypothetical protein